MLTEKQLEFLKNQKYAVFTTSNLSLQPHSIFVEINKIENNSIIITDNFMNTSVENIKGNKKVFILAFKENYEHILSITGEAIYHNSGELMEYVKKENEGFNPKGAIEIKITNIEEKTYNDL